MSNTRGYYVNALQQIQLQKKFKLQIQLQKKPIHFSPYVKPETQLNQLPLHRHLKKSLHKTWDFISWYLEVWIKEARKMCFVRRGRNKGGSLQTTVGHTLLLIVPVWSIFYLFIIWVGIHMLFWWGKSAVQHYCIDIHVLSLLSWGKVMFYTAWTKHVAIMLLWVCPPYIKVPQLLQSIQHSIQHKWRRSTEVYSIQMEEEYWSIQHKWRRSTEVYSIQMEEEYWSIQYTNGGGVLKTDVLISALSLLFLLLTDGQGTSFYSSQKVTILVEAFQVFN